MMSWTEQQVILMIIDYNETKGGVDTVANLCGANYTILANGHFLWYTKYNRH